MFHVSNLKKCLADASLKVPLKEIEISDKLHFIEEPVEIMDHEVKKLKQRRIPLVKVSWNSKRGAEFSNWSFMFVNYPWGYQVTRIVPEIIRRLQS
ncbi:hypothetical protein Tco_0914001 [Tanacetum coccineum]